MQLEELKSAVSAAVHTAKPIAIRGNGTKSCLGYADTEDHHVLDVSGYAGVIDYRPDELMIRARCGTRLADLKAVLAAEGQYLAAEPPDFGDAATLGGAVSAGLAGSGRVYRGAVKDAILGVGMILQNGEHCEFGGQVMKNVAGYDVSRLVCGAYGTLGVLTDVSLKVLPCPEQELTLALALDRELAQARCRDWLKRIPALSASSYQDGVCRVRLSGSEAAVNAGKGVIGGETEDGQYWQQLDGHQLPGFKAALDIWRLSVRSDEPCHLAFDLIDWGFSQRWLLDPETDPRQAYQGSGHWTRYRKADSVFEAMPFEPLDAVRMRLHIALKDAFDMDRVFNPGRMYREL